MQRIVTSDEIIEIETIITEHKRVVQFDDILESVSIESDDWNNDPPWENCDGWEHKTRELGYNDVGLTGSRGYARTSWNEPNVLIEIDDDDIIEKWGCNGYHGCSKQVRAELIAQVKRDALDQLVKWYENGWQYYQVVGDYNGCAGSVGGIDSYEYAEDCRKEVALEIADELTCNDYIVEGLPEQENWSIAEIWKDRYDMRWRFSVVHER